MSLSKYVLTALAAGLLLASSSVLAGKPSVSDCPCSMHEPNGWYDDITAVEVVEELEYNIVQQKAAGYFTRSLEVTHDGGKYFRIYTRENWDGYACGHINPLYPQYEVAPLTETQMKACDYTLVRSRNLLEGHFSH